MEYPIRTLEQLGLALRAQRKAKRLTQQNAGGRVGVLPKTISVLESSPEGSTLGSLFKLLSSLELEMVLRPKSPDGASKARAKGRESSAGEW